LPGLVVFVGFRHGIGYLAGMDFTIARRDLSPLIMLVASGRLDAESAGELGRAVDEELRRGAHEIAIDLAAVPFLSSAGIGVLLSSHKAAKAAGGRCLISAASPQVKSVLALSRIDRILMDAAAAGATATESASATHGGADAPSPIAADITSHSIRLVGLEHPAHQPLPATLIAGGAAASAAARPLPRSAFAIGHAAIDDGSPPLLRTGEFVAAGGAVFHRAPQPFAVVDYLIAEGDLVPAARFATGLVWTGIPTGRAGFEPLGEEPAVRFDDLVRSLVDLSSAPAIAFVVAGEIHGLVGVELIRSLADATAADHPTAGSREIASRWMSFSREPVLARHSALIVGVATRGAPAGPLASFVRPLGDDAAAPLYGHAHAAVFPHRPIKRGAADLPATIRDLTGSPPVAVMHLLADTQPVLGSGQSELVRGCVWFAPVTISGEPA
jgi:anti-anti-sigma factor